ncbi:MAG: polyprenyl synthetase family protein [Aggregatilineales bacterium]
MLKNIAARYLPDVDKTMRKIAEDRIPRDADLDVILRYAMGWVDEHNQPYQHTTGKRLRPLLLLMCNEAANGNWQNALPAAAAIEFVHNFSLIHDDIEDNSPTRHGRSAVWKVWGIPQAINAGDAMFALSYQSLEYLSETLPAERRLKIQHLFNNTMIELTRGQHLDMQFESQKTVTVENYISMITGKTAALLAVSAQIASLIAEDDDERAGYFADFAMNLGIAFQIHDDILGIWGDPEITGKSAATDIITRKKSLPVLYGLDKSTTLTAIYQKEDFGGSDVHEAVKILNQVNAQTYAQTEEKRYYDKAADALKNASPQGEAADFINTFMDFLFERQH